MPRSTTSTHSEHSMGGLHSQRGRSCGSKLKSNTIIKCVLMCNYFKQVSGLLTWICQDRPPSCSLITQSTLWNVQVINRARGRFKRHISDPLRIVVQLLLEIRIFDPDVPRQILIEIHPLRPLFSSKREHGRRMLRCSLAIESVS